MIIQGNASDFVFCLNEGSQCLQKSDGRPGKIGRTAKIGPILAVRVNEGELLLYKIWKPGKSTDFYIN